MVPGISVTIAFCRPARRFRRVDFPLFGGPAMTIVQPVMIRFAVFELAQVLIDRWPGKYNLTPLLKISGMGDHLVAQYKKVSANECFCFIS